MKSVLVLLALSSSMAFANATNYNLLVSRLQGSLDCTISDANGKSFDCNLHIAGAGEVAIDMTPVMGKNGNLIGYNGVDQVNEAGLDYLLSVGADANQATKGVSMITLSHDPSNMSVNATVAAAETGNTHVANISPLNVEIGDPSNIKVKLAFVVYADPADHIVKPSHRKDLTSYLINKIQPVVSAIKK